MVATVVVVAAGCGAHHTPRSVVASQDCFAAWNADGNEANRADLVDRGFAIGSVMSSSTFGDPAPGGTAHSGEGCGFLFHSKSRFVSYSGDWDGDTLLWTNTTGLHGAWTIVQDRSQSNDVRVLEDGRIAKR